MKYLLAAALVLIAWPVEAHEVPCSTNREGVIKNLETQHNESLAGMAIDSGNNFAELYTSDDGSWTLLITLPDGNTCVYAAGESWENVTTFDGPGV